MTDEEKQKQREELQKTIESLTRTARFALERAMELSDENDVRFSFRFGDGWYPRFEATYEPEGEFVVEWLSSSMRC